ncbi:response regulator transcription factor [Haloterrigena alkaliphila]|uniref:Response regulator transcription factor n=1 Tax=Haloterrigena alkaliphila TaxID=2816475 RepID=A0A8A2VJ66_9EURY|nr:response regulator transcription factor [Haloterrigena alkaliphila]QSX00373.1 response regulator transcription factor [Haloterrigena alkaliphila]
MTTDNGFSGPADDERTEPPPSVRTGSDGEPIEERTVETDDGSSHVLLLEDDDSLRRLLTHKLESSGYETTALADGRECWSFLTNEAPPDLVLLDVMVPGLDGFRLLGRIRNDDRLADVPVIVLTARSREEDAAKGFDLGADDYVMKPFSPSALVARVRRAISES